METAVKSFIETQKNMKRTHNQVLNTAVASTSQQNNSTDPKFVLQMKIFIKDKTDDEAESDTNMVKAEIDTSIVKTEIDTNIVKTESDTSIEIDTSIVKTEIDSNIVKTESDTNINRSSPTTSTEYFMRPIPVHKTTTQVPSTSVLNDSTAIKAPVAMCYRWIMNPAGKVKCMLTDIDEVDHFTAYLVTIPQIQPVDVKDIHSIEKCVVMALKCLPEPTTEMKNNNRPKSQLSNQEKFRRILQTILAKIRVISERSPDPDDVNANTCRLVIDASGKIQSVLNFCSTKLRKCY